MYLCIIDTVHATKARDSMLPSVTILIHGPYPAFLEAGVDTHGHVANVDTSSDERKLVVVVDGSALRLQRLRKNTTLRQ